VIVFQYEVVRRNAGDLPTLSTPFVWLSLLSTVIS